MIEGGEKINIIPDRCSLKIDIRFLPSQTESEIISYIQKQATIGKVLGGQIELRPPLRREAIKSDKSQPLIKEVVITIKIIKPDVKFIGVSYFTDAAVLGAHFQVPFFICGPGDLELAHVTDEHVEINMLFESYQLYNALLQSLVIK